MILSFSMSKAVRELPVIKTAQKAANEALSSLNYLKEGQSWFGKYIKLVIPDDDTGTEEEKRPYLTFVSAALFCKFLSFAISINTFIFHSRTLAIFQG